MALVKCKECNGEVSTRAVACPKCGAKLPKGMSLSKKLIYGFIAIGLMNAVVALRGKDAIPATQSAAHSQPASASSIDHPVATNEQVPPGAASYCSSTSTKSGQLRRVKGSENFLRAAPKRDSAKLINERATAAFKETHYLTIDSSVVVNEECSESGWSRVRVVQPESLSGTHIGWIKSDVLRTSPRNADGKEVFSETDFTWDKGTSPYKKVIVAGVNRIHQQNQRCRSVDTASIAKSTSKGSAADPVFYVTCRDGSDSFNAFFSKSEVEKNASMDGGHIPREKAVNLCEAYVRASATHPSTVDFSKVMSLQVVEHPNGRTTVNSTFTAKNGYGVEAKYNVSCMLDKSGAIEGNIAEAK